MNFNQIKINKAVFLFLIVSIFGLQRIVFSQISDIEINKSERQFTLYVTVNDSQGKYYEGFSTEDFHITVEGKEQEILSVQRADEPISMGILVDISDSMEKNLMK